MLASCKSKQENVSDDFSPLDLLLEMCAQHDIELANGGIVTFQRGWKVLVLEFLNNLKQYPVMLIDVIDTYGQLDIKFEMKAKKDELQVWRLIDGYRIQSRNTCMECGQLNYLFNVPESHRKVCRECFAASKKGMTDTWLDKYE